MELFEKKGLARIILFLYMNNGSIDSKYKLIKELALSSTTINKRIKLLVEMKLIKTSREYNSRKKIKLILTDLGSSIAESLKKILEKLNG